MYRLNLPAALCLAVMAGCGPSSEQESMIVDITDEWQQIPIAQQEADLNTAKGGYVLLGDFDDDGRLDAASGFVSSQAVSVHIQNSSRSWSSTVVSSDLGAVNSLAAADLDNNDRLDVVAATGSGKTWIVYAPSYSGTAPANWQTEALQNPLAISEWNDVKIGNFDNLPALDIVAISAKAGVIVLWRSEGLPISANDYQPFVIASNLPALERLAVADVDGDGNLDLVACGEAGGVIWLENPKPPNATQPWIKHVISTRSGPSQLIAVDLDADGDIDVGVTNPAAGEVLWYECLGFPRTDPWEEHLMADLSPGRPDAISFCDFNNDGQIDVLAGTSTVDQTIYWLKRMGDARALWLAQIVDKPGYNIGELPSGDIDGLGTIDFATTLAGSSTPVVWYKDN